MKTETQKDSHAVAVAEKPTPITKICVGKKFGLRVIEAIRRARSFAAGEAHFPGISKAKLEISNGMAPQDDTYFDNRGELPVEIGGPKARFGVDAVRRITEKLGIQEDRPMQRIAEAIEKSGDGGNGTGLGDAIKVLWRVCSRAAVVNHGVSLLHHIHHRLIHRPTETKPDSLQKFFDGCKKKFTNDRARESLEAKIKDSARRRKRSVLELATVVESLVYSEPDKAEAKKIAELLLDALYQDELLLWEGVGLCAKTEKFKVQSKPRGGKERELTGILVSSDNERIVHASRHPDAGSCDITIVRNSEGNVGIFIKKGLGVSLMPLWRMIQAQELLFNGWSPRDIPWIELADEKGHEEVRDLWRLIWRKGMVVNGINQNDIAATRLQSNILVDIVQHAFHPVGITDWRKFRKITFPPKEGFTNLGAAADAAANVASHTPAPETKPAATTTLQATPETQTPKADANAPAKGKARKGKLMKVVSIAELEKVLDERPA